MKYGPESKIGKRLIAQGKLTPADFRPAAGEAPVKRHKFNAQPTAAGDDSQREGGRRAELELAVRVGLIRDLRCQVPYDLVPAQRDAKGKYVAPVRWVADFVYVDAETGATVVEDSKPAYMRKLPVFRIKLKLMLQVHHITILET